MSETRATLVPNDSKTKSAAAPAVFSRFFEQRAGETPGQTAVSLATPAHTGSAYSYQQLNDRANQLAHYLKSIGVGPGVFVGIYLERSLEMLVALLGVLKSGGAYVPLDPIYPEQRISYILDNAGVQIVLSQTALVEDLPVAVHHTICLDEEWDLVAGQPTTNLPCAPNPDDLAYLIYTSGSTGRPKGVLIQHQALLNFLQTMSEQPGLTARDILMAVTTLSFDIAALELFLPLLVGATVIIAVPEVAGDGNLLQSALSQSGATAMQATPATWNLLVESGWQGDKNLKILCGGEALPRQLADALLQRGRVVWNLYGPTETTIWSSRCQLEYDEPSTTHNRTVPIGYPIAHTQLHVLDGRLTAVHSGIAGELYIGGRGLAVGYHGRAALTAAAFVPDPFCDEPGGRLYKTGDLVRVRQDENMEFLGRIDNQVKIRGFRIELGEIEAILGDYPGLGRSIVMARQDTNRDHPEGEKRLVAYSVPDPSAPRPNQSEIRRYLEDKLPGYMIPAAFVFLDAFPLTPNKKIDRRALPAPGTERPDIDTIYTAPTTELQMMLVNMWQETLGLEQVGIDDNFFELGGDSLKGAYFISRLQDKLGGYMYISALLEAPTVAEMARYLKTHYADALAHFNQGRNGQVKTAESLKTNQSIDESDVRKMRRWLDESMPYAIAAPGTVSKEKNPQAIFILSPPRSGSTLLRVVLAGHPALFAPPELDLLTFPTLVERQETLAQADSFRLEGTIRALMAIHNCSAEKVQKIMDDYEGRDMTTQDFYGRLQRWVEPQILVDKSITYANHLETLQRAEEYFENPLYIHLLRHPHGMIRSFEDVRLDRIYFREQHDFSVRQLGELVWLINHRNILDFLKTVPPERQFRLQYESLAKAPRETAESLAQFLNLDFDDGMLKPYEERQERMTDGIYDVSASRMIGDVKFHGYNKIEAAAADRWKKELDDDFLSDMTWDLAEAVGYGRPSAPADEIDAETAAHLLTQLDDLSDEEVQALLSQML